MKLADLAGIGRQMPLTMAAFVVAGLAIIGTPGTAGFISKWYLAVGAFQKGWWPLVFLILASSMLAMVYIGRVVEVAWFREPLALAQKAQGPAARPCSCRCCSSRPQQSISASTRRPRQGLRARPRTTLLGGLK